MTNNILKKPSINYVLAANLATLEIIFCVHAIIRDLFINKDLIKNAPSVIIFTLFEICLIISIIIYCGRGRGLTLFMISVLFIFLRSVFGLFFFKEIIILSIIRVSQMLICLWAFATQIRNPTGQKK